MPHRYRGSASLYLLIVSLYRCACHPCNIKSLGVSNIFARDEYDPDPNDFSYITGFAAIGDSYSAGIGAGSPYDSDTTCARFDSSFPAQLNAAEGLGDPSKRTFQFLACSGAKTGDVWYDQIPKLGENQNIITLSVGGNDVGLTSILDKCVFQFSANPQSNCDGELASAADYVKNGLTGNLRRVISTAQKKLSRAPDSAGILYVLGYAKFFDADTDQCDSQTWSFWYNDYLNPLTKPYLTKARRKTMNDLVDQVNAAIKEEVLVGGFQVVYVDYDAHVTKFRGRYCDNGTIEPEPNALGLQFYEWGTVDPGEDSGIW